MNSILKKSVMAGLLLGAVAGHADVVVDDFTGGTTNNMLTNGGAWIADGDVFLGGTSKVTDLVDGSDLVKGDVFSGDNIQKAYTEDFAITSKIYVKANVNEVDKKWAYAGWVMDFITPKPVDTVTKIYDLKPWEKYDEVNISSCTSLEITLSFDVDRILWIDLYSPQIERINPLAPQWGWKYTGTGLLETKKFNLTGITGPAQKWADAVNKVPLSLASVQRIRFLYEGLVKGSAVAAYDTVGHILKIKKINLVGGACAVVEARGSALPIVNHAAHKADVGFTAANGQIRFGSLAQSGELKVTVRDMSGKVMTQGLVNGIRPSLDVSALKNGVYSVQAVGAKLNVSNTVTLLN